MEKIAENHWKGNCFEIKVICGAFFVRPDRQYPTEEEVAEIIRKEQEQPND